MKGITDFISSIFTTKPSPDAYLKPFNVNPFSQIRLLEGHTDSVRVCENLNDDRFFSASDDGTLVVWNSHTCEEVCKLEGHTGAVTCVHVIDETHVASGSTDRSIRFWDTTTGLCTKEQKKAHEGSVMAFGRVLNQVCSGGNDMQLCLWTSTGDLVKQVQRQEGENLNCLLCLPDSGVVTASSSLHLYYYNLANNTAYQMPTYHRDEVKCLVHINENTFASGSIDGVIVVWKSEDLTPLKKLTYPERFFSADLRCYTNCVNQLAVLGKHYIAACIGKGFQIFDSVTGDRVIECVNAHDVSVNSIISVFGGVYFVTCGADMKLKLWKNEHPLDEYTLDRKPKRRLFQPSAPSLVAEMCGHSNHITTLLKVSDHSFISASNDNLIIMWTNPDLANSEQYYLGLQNFVENNPQLFDRLGYINNNNSIMSGDEGSQTSDNETSNQYSADSGNSSIGNVNGDGKDTEPIFEGGDF